MVIAQEVPFCVAYEDMHPFKGILRGLPVRFLRYVQFHKVGDIDKGSAPVGEHNGSFVKGSPYGLVHGLRSMVGKHLGLEIP